MDDRWYEDVFKNATCKVETFGFSEKADLRATDVQHISRPGYLGVKYQVSGLMDFDVEIDIPGDFSVYNSLTLSRCAGILMCLWRILRQRLKWQR